MFGFSKNATGNISSILALALPVFATATGAAMDYSSLQRQRSQMQAVADAAALGSARELLLPSRTQS